MEIADDTVQDLLRMNRFYGKDEKSPFLNEIIPLIQEPIREYDDDGSGFYGAEKQGTTVRANIS